MEGRGGRDDVECVPNGVPELPKSDLRIHVEKHEPIELTQYEFSFHLVPSNREKKVRCNLLI